MPFRGMLSLQSYLLDSLASSLFFLKHNASYDCKARCALKDVPYNKEVTAIQ